MKLPIQRVPGTTPPKFVYYQTVNLPQGGTQRIKHEGCVPSSMEAALCDLLKIIKQLETENELLRNRVADLQEQLAEPVRSVGTSDSIILARD